MGNNQLHFEPDWRKYTYLNTTNMFWFAKYI